MPGPKLHFLWGRYHLLQANHTFWLDKWTKEYGDTFGAFWGNKPMLVSIDLDLQQKVLVTEFSNFVNRARTRRGASVVSDYAGNGKGFVGKIFAALTTRTPTKPSEYKGITLEKGLGLLFPTRTVHYDARYWPKPLTYDPDRLARLPMNHLEMLCGIA
ncbi:cytochrome P450 3A16-like [Tropilaelaps mercedesae]|uniref:Cytochrome P450 3A16-like n=1 Tax=Tropilaelaps mercedesae TaxID=418985 RepID=A0A1V9XI30_9ACAR|nr:cytochrome P450 3A16-like [Tropilaelaps mercedesae]